ncbi:MAG: fluoride efflux transporter CrcB [Caulobacteraceae bacterium]
MEKLLLVFVGGGAGSMTRYLVGQQLLRLAGPDWPWGTFTVNIVGGMLMGALAGWLAHAGTGAQTKWALLLAVGFLGGFTTFSAFSLETALMIERKAFSGAAAYALASVLLSVGALWLGLMLSRRVFA